MPIKNYTTQIDYFKTIAEIEKCLVEHHALYINKKYEGILPVALYFMIIKDEIPYNFKLPIRWQATLKILEKAKIPLKFQNKEQSIRVSWRIIKDWITAQMAIVETEMVEMEQVFLPYLIDQEKRTLFDRLKDNNQLKKLTGS
ncbi:MAG TPA: hypothetical protein VE912_09215 [Bacteroidales bacterium]|nr:hypothetical protein [Bacteroidales bacterium]